MKIKTLDYRRKRKTWREMVEDLQVVVEARVVTAALRLKISEVLQLRGDHQRVVHHSRSLYALRIQASLHYVLHLWFAPVLFSDLFVVQFCYRVLYT